MMHHAKKPVGFFLKDKKLVIILPFDKEEAQAAIARVAADWAIDPTTVSSIPPKAEADGYAGFEVIYDRHLAPREYKAKPWPGHGAANAVDGVEKFYAPQKVESPPSPTGTPPSVPQLIAPVDYAALLGRRPTE